MNEMRKGLVLAVVSLSLSLCTLWAASDDTLKADPNEGYNPNLLMFTGEVHNFLELALKAKNSDLPEEKEKALVEEMIQTSLRVSRVYFQEMTEANRQQLNQFLSEQLKQNETLKNYFIILGNAFAASAEKIVKQNETHRKSIRVWSTVGGTVLGIAVGGGYLYFQKAFNSGSYWAVYKTEKYLIASGMVLLGAGVGYGGSLIYLNRMPVDRSIQNASDFVTRYPHGEDFIKELNPTNLDLALGMSELEDAR